MLIIITKNLVLAEGQLHGLDDTKITAEPKYSINFTEPKKKSQKLYTKKTCITVKVGLFYWGGSRH